MNNKFAKLPIFLGAVVAVCGIILALVYSFTDPIVKKHQKEQAAEAYVNMYKDFGVKAEEIGDDIVVNDITGCSSKVEVVNPSVAGVAYTCKCSGFGGEISFIVSFANGQYLGYKDLGNSETSGYGKEVIKGLQDDGKIKGIDGTETLTNNDGYNTFIAGKSVTGKAIASVVENCRVDYMAWYETHK